MRCLKHKSELMFTALLIAPLAAMAEPVDQAEASDPASLYSCYPKGPYKFNLQRLALTTAAVRTNPIQSNQAN